MADARRHDYRLSARPTAFFADALEAALSRSPEIVLPGDPGAARYGQRRAFLWDLFGDGADGFDFHLVVLSASGAPEAAHPLVRRISADLVAMDDAARAIPSDQDENEYLWSVTLDAEAGAVQLDYAATAFNTGWSVHFRLDETGGWTCLGIPDWREPGRFIR